MTVTNFDGWACRQARTRLDSYLDSELLVETNLEMEQHFARCPDCARESETRRELRARVRSAARQTPVPAGLEALVRDRIRAERPSRTRWNLMAIAAAVLACFAGWVGYQRAGFAVPPQLAAILRIGEGDHLHCAVIRQSVLKPVKQDKLAPEWEPLLATARQHVPADMILGVAHQCHTGGRTFIHMSFKDGDRLLSVIVTRRQSGESLGRAIQTGAVEQYQAAAFESGAFFVYTVSNLSKKENLRILQAVAPEMRPLLKHLSA